MASGLIQVCMVTELLTRFQGSVNFQQIWELETAACTVAIVVWQKFSHHHNVIPEINSSRENYRFSGLTCFLVLGRTATTFRWNLEVGGLSWMVSVFLTTFFTGFHHKNLRRIVIHILFTWRLNGRPDECHLKLCSLEVYLYYKYCYRQGWLKVIVGSVSCGNTNIYYATTLYHHMSL